MQLLLGDNETLVSGSGITLAYRFLVSAPGGSSSGFTVITAIWANSSSRAHLFSLALVRPLNVSGFDGPIYARVCVENTRKYVLRFFLKCAWSFSRAGENGDHRTYRIIEGGISVRPFRRSHHTFPSNAIVFGNVIQIVIVHRNGRASLAVTGLLTVSDSALKTRRKAKISNIINWG